MKIGILETGLVPETLVAEHGTYPSMFERLLGGRGFTFRTWSVVGGDIPQAPEDADGWLITGSRHGAYEDHPWIPPLEEFIRSVAAADRPLVGICFGHQIVAQAMGGRVEKFSGGWSVGPTEYTFADGTTRTISAFHQDQVVERPEGAQVVATTDFCANAALLYPGKAYTVQPHPEFEDPYTEGLLRDRGPGLVPEPVLAGAGARIGTPLDTGWIADQFDTFFRERRIP